jgi:ADP-dependent NAD(P)H-hydrate dehydratase / NAD(P)H-hydrate epimerase
VIVVTAAEMRALDRWTIEHGTPGHVLMERAGAGAARVLRERLRRPRGPAIVVCGRGNNGGDGFVVARHLRRARIPVEVWLVARPDEVKGDAARMLATWQRGRGRVHELTTADATEAFARRLGRAAVVVDALFGTGLNAPVTGLPATIIDLINASGAPVLALDLASGLSADTGMPLGTAIRATATATFGFPKVGQVIHPGVELTGLLAVVDIGIPPAAVTHIGPRVSLLEGQELGSLLRPRPRDAHKGSFGHVLVIAGSRGKTGAALLAAEGAARAGAGLVTLAVPASLQSVFEGRVRETMTAALPDDGAGGAELGDGQALEALLTGRDVVVCGPGLGVTPGTRALVAHLARHAAVPLVLDADALNAVAGTDLLHLRAGPTIVTPHPGEMARLRATRTEGVQADRLGAARELAAAAQVVVVLKGARTVVASPDGGAAISPTGNPGMASGGTGDVLAGILGGLLAQGLTPFEAATLGVFAHGAAGDAVVAHRGEAGLLAGDLLPELPSTLARLQAAGRPEAPRRRGYRAGH